MAVLVLALAMCFSGTALAGIEEEWKTDGPPKSGGGSGAINPADIDIFYTLRNEMEQHRDFANSEQEDELELVEAEYLTVKAKASTQSPWSEAVSGGEGISALLTPAIKNDEGFQNYIQLKHLMGKTMSINWNAAPNTALEQRLADFVDDNDNVDILFNFDGAGMKEAAASFSALGLYLMDLYTEFQAIKTEAAAEGGTIVILDGTTPVSQLTEAEIHAVMADMLTKLLKDFNALIFSTKDTWEDNFNSLLDSENKKLVGVMFGKQMADALADIDINMAINSYLTSSRVLTKIAQKQTALFNTSAGDAVDALYDLIADIVEGLLEEDELAPVKAAIENVGWSVQNFIDANKHIADAADADFNSRIINLNMILGAKMDIFKNDALSSYPVFVDISNPNDEYNVNLHLVGHTLKVSVINVVNSFIYNMDGTTNSDVSIEDDEGELEFVVRNGKTGDFIVKFYRSGGPNNVFGYLNEYDVEIDSTGDPIIPVTSVSITNEATINLRVGNSRQLSARVLPNNATNKNVIWQSSNSSIATVSQSGVVRAVSPGTVTITVRTVDGDYTSTRTVNVTRSATTSTGGTGGGGVIRRDGITIDAGSSSAASQISVISSAVGNISQPQEGLTPASFGYSLHGLSSSPVKLTIDIDSYDDSKTYAIYRLNEDTGEWVILPTSTLSNDRKTVTAQYDGVGSFAVFAVDRAAFDDLAGHWSEAQIMYLYNQGIVEGYSERLFAPDRTISRAEFAAIVCRMTGVQSDNGVVYPDTEGHWAQQYISTATKYGYMVGYDDGEFKPDIGISREQILAVLIRAKYFDKAVINEGSEIEMSGDALIEKIKIEFFPELYTTVSFVDFEQTSDWAKGYMGIAFETNLISGYEDGTVRPLNFGTRAEAIVLAMRALGL